MGSYSIDSPWDLGGHAAEGGKILLGGEVIGIAQVAVLQASLALGVEVGWCCRCMCLWMLALWVARAVDESGIQARGYLRSGVIQD